MNTEMLQGYMNQAIAMWISYAPKIIGALIVIFIGFKIAKMIGNMIEKVMGAKKIDPTISKFSMSLVKNLLKALVIVAAIGMLWVQTTSFVAIFGAAGLAIGMALSGTLGHFASGVMILLFKPYKVGDLIETAGHLWNVKEVQIFNTIITSLDGKKIIIPNSEAIWSSIVNYSAHGKKRVDLDIGIWYGDSIDKAREVMHKVADDNKYVLHDEWVTIAVKELGDSAVIFLFRTWATTENYWDAYFSLTEEVKKAFDATKWELNFPYPQQDVHMHNVK